MLANGLTVTLSDSFDFDAPKVGDLLRYGDTRPGHVFLQPALLRACLAKARQNRQSALLVQVHAGAELKTIWPIKIKRELGVSIATDLTSPVTQYSDVIGEPFAAATLSKIGRLLYTKHGVDAIFLRNIRPCSGFADACPPDASSCVASADAPYIDLRAYPDFDSFSSTFGKNPSRTRRQRRQKLEAQHGNIHFEVLSGARAQAVLPIALAWKHDWLCERGIYSRVFDGARNEAALLASCQDDAVRLSVMSVNEVPIAIEMGFVAGTNYAAYLGAFDPAFAIYSAGQEQMMRTIEWCIQNGFQHYDLLPPAAAYKDRWTRGLAPVPVTDHCLALSSLGNGYGLLLRHAKPNARRLVDAVPADMRRKLIQNGRLIIGATVAATAATVVTLAD